MLTKKEYENMTRPPKYIREDTQPIKLPPMKMTARTQKFLMRIIAMSVFLLVGSIMLMMDFQNPIAIFWHSNFVLVVIALISIYYLYSFVYHAKILAPNTNRNNIFNIIIPKIKEMPLHSIAHSNTKEVGKVFHYLDWLSILTILSAPFIIVNIIYLYAGMQGNWGETVIYWNAFGEFQFEIYFMIITSILAMVGVSAIIVKRIMLTKIRRQIN